jgi:hypothetical protein
VSEGDGDDPRSRSGLGDDQLDDSLFDRVVPENLKRRIEAGVESVLKDERVKHFVQDFKLPKEVVAHARNQIDETKRAAVEVIARETRAFLEQTNLADELAKLLTQVTLQVDIRFIPNDKAVKSDKAGSRPGIFTRFRSSPPPSPEPDHAEPAAADDPSSAEPADS